MTSASKITTLAVVVAALTAGTAACGITGGPTHELTFQVSGSAPADQVVVDPPGQQSGDAETLRGVALPWERKTSTGFGFARVVATSKQAVTCRILVNGKEAVMKESPNGGTVECRANVQDN